MIGAALRVQLCKAVKLSFMVNFLFCLSLTTEGKMICEFNLPISFWYFSAYINRVAGLENLAPGRHCTSVHECFY